MSKQDYTEIRACLKCGARCESGRSHLFEDPLMHCTGCQEVEPATCVAYETEGGDVISEDEYDKLNELPERKFARAPQSLEDFKRSGPGDRSPEQVFFEYTQIMERNDMNASIQFLMLLTPGEARGLNERIRKQGVQA